MFLSLKLEIIAFAIVIVLFFFSISIHYVPKNFLWVLKKKNKTLIVLKPGLHFIIPFTSKLVRKTPTDNLKGEIYLNDVTTKDGSNECFKVDYSYQISNISLYSYEFDLAEYIIDTLRNYIIYIDKDTLHNDSHRLSDIMLSLLKSNIGTNGYSLTKITIYHEK